MRNVRIANPFDRYGLASFLLISLLALRSCMLQGCLLHVRNDRICNYYWERLSTSILQLHRQSTEQKVKLKSKSIWQKHSYSDRSDRMLKCLEQKGRWKMQPNENEHEVILRISLDLAICYMTIGRAERR